MEKAKEHGMLTPIFFSFFSLIKTIQSKTIFRHVFECVFQEHINDCFVIAV